MCGIAGFLGAAEIDCHKFANTIKGMLARINYRGPDEMGYYFDSNNAFGSVRLSIIDIESGQQPLLDQSQRYLIVYNGELYNYKELAEELKAHGYTFQTSSDTEVLLKAWIHWGLDALSRFNGAYAFAIYDRVDNSCLLVRDRFGKRPLFYATVNGTLVFASELKCFLEYPGVQFNWDTEALNSVLSIWTPLPEQTVFQDFMQVPPGGWLLFKNGTYKLGNYFELNLQAPDFKGSKNEAIEQTRYQLEQSVRLRMRSDVEVGTYLSGGLDSSIVTGLVCKQSPFPVHTFSVGFEDDDFDESLMQNEASKYFGTKHHSLKVSTKSIAEDFPIAVWHSEVPLFRTALVPLYSLSRLVHETGLKVILTGEGADEAFLGYDIFKETLIRQSWSKKSPGENEEAVARLYPYLKHFNKENISSLASVYDRFSQGIDEPFFSHDLRFSNAKFSQKLLRNTSQGLKLLSDFVNRHSEQFSHLSPIRRTQWLEFNTLLAGYLLSSQGDRMSLAHSVENRCPFLDYQLVELAQSFPVDWRLNNGFDEKHILKEAFKGEVPDSILTRPKQPYRAPDAQPFIGLHRPEYVDELLSAKSIEALDFLNADFCKRFAEKMKSSEPSALSPREGNCLVMLLSVLILDRSLVQGRNTEYNRILNFNLSTQLDGRNLPIFRTQSVSSS